MLLMMPYANYYTLFGMDFIEKVNTVINIPQYYIRIWYFADNYKSHELKFDNTNEATGTV